MAISSASIHFDRNAGIRLEYVEAVSGAFRINEIVDGYTTHTASVFIGEDKAETLKAAIKAFNTVFEEASEPIQEAA
jgi:hypothetical protein